MKIRENLTFMRALFINNLKTNLTSRNAFFLQSFFMIVNNLILFSVWWLLFQKIEEIRGWKLVDIAALYGVVTGGYGLAVIFGGGALKLSRMISEGDLDSYMTQPKNLLLYVMGSHSALSGWGDMVSSVFFLTLSGYVTFSMIPLVFIILICVALIFLATAILIHSLAFWIKSVSTLSQQLLEFTVILSVYPPSIYQGILKILLFTIIPAGFMGYFPVELLRQPSLIKFLIVIVSTLFYGYLAIIVFNRGLRYYESGSRFVVKY